MSESGNMLTDAAVKELGEVARIVRALPPTRRKGAGFNRGRNVAPALDDVWLFMVRVEKTGGSNGSKTTKAAWQYTFKTLDGEELGTGAVPAMPIPNGKRVFQTGTFGADTAGIGTAYWDGDTAVLWDAGEVYATGGCP